MTQAVSQPISRSEADKTVLIVPHTHWDREWYWSLAGYRHRLIDLMDDVLSRLETPDAPDGLPVFWLDSQIAPVLDYLESKPENTDRIRRLIQQNKLRIGPWFIQADEHLVDGEACVRNLLLGRFYGQMFGPLQSVGYVPDQFGHTAQLPQILRKAGIDNAVFWRAIVDQSKNRLTWRGPDGSEVFVLWLQDSYANAMELPEDVAGAVQKIKEAIDKDRKFNADGIRLMMAGVDHSLTAPVLKQAAAALQQEWSIPVQIVGLDEVVQQSRTAAQKNLPQVQGELLYSPHLHGCWTSRNYLKQANDRCCRLLEQWAEPLAAFALWSAGIDLRAELRTAWKELVLNHPHDSICGCSTDEVHRAMMARFEIAETMARNVATRAALALQLAAAFPGQKIDVLNRSINRIQDRTPTHLTVWNPAGRTVGETFLVDILWPDENIAGLQFRDSRDQVLSTQTIEQEPQHFRRWRPHGNPTRHAGRRFRLAVQPAEPIPASGFAAFKVEPLTAATLVDHMQEMKKTSERSSATPAGRMQCRMNVLENETLRIEVQPDGSCDLMHKPSGRTFRRLCTLADFGEAGDSYSHIVPTRDEQILPQAGTVSITAAGPLFSEIQVHTKMMLPAGRSADKRGRSKRRVACPVTVRYSLGAGWPYAKVQIDFDNRVRHHLLRAIFPTGATPESYAGVSCSSPATAGSWPATAFSHHVACVPFASLQRGTLPVEWQQTDRGQMPLWPDGWPQLGWIDLPSEKANLAIIAPGTPHYDIQPNGTCRVNLLRTFSHLLWSWEPMYSWPEGQCLGRQTFQFALYPHTKDYVTDQIHAVAGMTALGLHATLGESFPQELLQGSIVGIEPSAVRITALKPADNNHSLILRLLNDSNTPTDTVLRAHLPVRAIEEVDLLERPIAASRVKFQPDGTARLAMKPYEFVTVLLTKRA